MKRGDHLLIERTPRYSSISFKEPYKNKEEHFTIYGDGISSPTLHELNKSMTCLWKALKMKRMLVILRNFLAPPIEIVMGEDGVAGYKELYPGVLTD